MRVFAGLMLVSLLCLSGQEFTRGIGVYPGAPKEYSGPTMVVDSATYRNLALRHPAYQSSSYDYNLTAQLVTDGIKETALPRWLTVSTSQQGVLPRQERELLLDANWVTTVSLSGKNPWIQLEFGGAAPPEIDRIDIDGAVTAREPDIQNWSVVVSGSPDGQAWKALGRDEGMARTTGEIRPRVALAGPARSRFYRVEFQTGRALQWKIGELKFFLKNQPVHVGGPFHFTSTWKPAGNGDEWVFVDLGAVATFDRIVLAWLRRPAAASLEVSDDAVNWKALRDVPDHMDDLRLPSPVRGRYVRLSMKSAASPEGYLLREFEVYGRGGTVPKAQASSPGGVWRVQRDSLVRANGATLSLPGYADRDWVAATVPATILSSYYNAGALPDPNFGDNQLQVSDSFFYADFWYRNEFQAPAQRPGRRTYLNFKGVNWKAEVYLNGAKLGRIEGAFLRGRFDVTTKLRPGTNALAVRIEKVATPGAMKEKTFESPGTNGGALGADNPTYHAAVGWDWIPTIRGRDAGIWNDVYLSESGAVTIENPFAASVLPLPDTTSAEETISATLRNHTAVTVSGVVRGRFGDEPFEQRLTVPANGEAKVSSKLQLQNPKLWWPNGYGDPNLYTVNLAFETTPGAASDTKTFQTGVRQFTYSEEGGALKIWINGRRFVGRGGNWGFGESNLNYRAREYETAVRYHRDMNFTMIRNWVGMIGEDAFYEACDRNGIVVWQDFWLANPWDGPNPDSSAMFLRNVEDTVNRIRNHPSIGLYCGRNEGYPGGVIEAGIRKTLAEAHPGIEYIPSSADDSVSGHGPYRAMPLKYYFTDRATTKLHSELGMPNIVSMDSLRAMMPEEQMWPQGRMWGLHDFSLRGAQGGESFRQQIDRAYGGAESAAQWVELAQFVNYEGHRAMFEAQGKNRMGLLIWMSHPAWPSLVWQTYDYFFEPTAAYFGMKKASEPLHIQWNPVTETVEVVNYSAGNATGLTATAEVLNLDGSVKWQKSATLDSVEDSIASPIKMEYPAGLSAVHFLRLKLMRDGATVSQNFYWRGSDFGDYRALRTLPKVNVQANTTAKRDGDRWLLTTELANTSNAPALMIRLKVVREKSGDRILPALYGDNYVALMPGEQRSIVTEVGNPDTRGEAPRIVIEGFNLAR